MTPETYGGQRGDAMPAVLALVALPPPIHGQSVVNAAVAARLRTCRECQVKIVDIGPGELRRNVRYHATRILRVLSALFHEIVFARYKTRTIYTVVDSGFGIFYNFLLVGIGRILRYRIVLHHHTAAYTLKFRPAFDLLARISGRRAIHVVLGPAMATDLAKQYSEIGTVLVLHNTCAVSPAVEIGRKHQGMLRFGFLSNLSNEKGLDIVLDVLAQANALGLEVTLRLAGPATTPAVAARIALAQATFGKSLEVLGPLSGAAKDDFFDQTDIFLFPSRYPYEAQPLVVLEAMAHGCAVVVTDCGYLAELIGSCGTLVADQRKFVTTTLECSRRWLEKPELLLDQGRASRDRFVQLCTEGEGELENLIGVLIGARGEADPQSIGSVA